MSFTCLGQTTNINEFFAPLFKDKSLVWSAETNSFRTGVLPVRPAKEIDIWVLSSTNPGLIYLYPPSGKPPKLELQDSNGVIILPIKNKMDGELPQRLSESNFRKFHFDGFFHGNGAEYGYIMLAKDRPHILTTFAIGDVYQIEKEADYSLTVFPVIYKFETNGEYADRIDLPIVTTKIHLVPTEEK
jgi:hypothetical protein